MRALLFAIAAIATAAAASAQAPPAIEPPGAGMIDQPCPTMPQLPPRKLSEPGNVIPTAPELSQLYTQITTYRQKYDWNGLCRYKAENAALPKGERVRVVFMGDSITENWVRYDPGFFTGGVLGRGISGQTSPQMLARFYQDVVALKPDIVQIMAGTNDIAGNTGPNSPQDFENTVASMVGIAQANGIKVIIASIPPTVKFSWAPALQPGPRVAQLNTWLKDYAGKHGAVWADYHSVLAAADGAPKDGMTIDGVHPGTEGYRLMRAVAVKAIADAEKRKK